MAIIFDYPAGATPLDADELACLIPEHITMQSQLNEWEQLNIEHGETWALRQRKGILDETFIRQLHQHMFGETWTWAGKFRTSNKNIGVDWSQVSVKLRDLLDDVRHQIDNAVYSPDEIAVRFHHRLVAIHAFPNGNGRHARLMADLLIRKLGQPRFTWGRKNLMEPSATRKRYIAALQAADKGDINQLLAFARD